MRQAASPASTELSRTGVAKIEDGQCGVTQATEHVTLPLLRGALILTPLTHWCPAQPRDCRSSPLLPNEKRLFFLILFIMLFMFFILLNISIKGER